MTNTGPKIQMAIEKEVSRYSFVKWLEEWDISEVDWDKFMEAGKAAFNEEGEQDDTD